MVISTTSISSNVLLTSAIVLGAIATLINKTTKNPVTNLFFIYFFHPIIEYDKNYLKYIDKFITN